MKSVLVTGDFILDHHIYEGRRHHFADSQNPGVTVREALGGAALVHQLLWQDGTAEYPARPLLLPPGWTSSLAVQQPQAVNLGHQAFAFWRPRSGGKGGSFWRVTEAMGFGSATTQPPCGAWPPSTGVLTPAKILVLADGGMGFRQSEGCWKTLPFKSAVWIVYKTEAPHFAGGLWKKISAQRNKLVVVISASELRKTTARISTGLSWEATLQDLHRELNRGALQPLARSCAHLVISFGVEGVLWIDFTSRRSSRFPPAQFVFDAPVVEGDRSVDLDGRAFGLMSCLTAGVVWALTSPTAPSSSPNLVEGIEGGLSAMRDLLERGHGPADQDSDSPKGFPAQRLAEVIRSPRHLLSRSLFPWDDNISKSDWSLLRQTAPDLEARARLVAEHGDIALHNVPHLQINKLFTADRREIECLRTLVQTIRRYRERSEPGKKPLSLGIFGPPGSGKSFAVEEIAKHFFGKESWLLFNLSQFKDEADLIGAFHQIRDRALEGIIPVAFFDEFDSQNLRWLQYLLAPMQDGRFQEGQITHPIGKCVFVFAGGTSFTFETFTPASESSTGRETEAERHFRLAKGPDFSSRLDGTLDVLGPNRGLRLILDPRATFNPAKHTRAGTHFFEKDPHDHYMVIRRARMVRFELKVPGDTRLDMDSGLLAALLRVPHYKHGARSLGKIAQSIQSSASGSIRPSSLPPAQLLGVHVDSETFLACMILPTPLRTLRELTREKVEAIAPVIHEHYRELGRRNRWLKDADDKSFRDFKDFRSCEDMSAPAFNEEEVAAWKKESNREAARRMPKLLHLAGLCLDTKPSKSPDISIQIQMTIESLLELLAKAEHSDWMEWHFEHGWKFNKERNNEAKQHDLLLPYSQLNEENRNKDRSQVRHFPAFAGGAGLRIAFV